MTTLVEALLRKFDALVNDEISPECKLKPASRTRGRSVCTSVIAMDHQDISSIGNPQELTAVFETVRELDLSTNKIRLWSDVFSIIENSPNLQVLNLSYNPLHNSALFFEAQPYEDAPITDASFCSTCKFESTNTDQNETTLLEELSFCEGGSLVQNKENITDPNSSKQAANTSCLPTPKLVCLSHQLSTLVLNSTRIPWKRVLSLLSYLPNLSNLHAALNDYDCCCRSCVDNCNTIVNAPDDLAPRFPQLTQLYLSENRLDKWSTVCCLGTHFPGLKHLVLIKNPILRIDEPSKVNGGGEEDDLAPRSTGFFDNLVDLNLMGTGLSSWECLDALRWWMPSLLHLRLGKDLLLFEVSDVYSNDRVRNVYRLFCGSDSMTARNDVIARMPSLTSYNATPISEDEREKAERDFIRRFGQVSPEERPDRYWELESHHGQVAPLASVDLSPKKAVRLRILLNNEEKWHTCYLRKSVGKLRQELCALFSLPEKDVKKTRLIYYDMGMLAATGPEELRNPQRELYTYHPEDGDMIEIAYRG